jgi:hypothetical protein
MNGYPDLRFRLQAPVQLDSDRRHKADRQQDTEKSYRNHRHYLRLYFRDPLDIISSFGCSIGPEYAVVNRFSAGFFMNFPP